METVARAKHRPLQEDLREQVERAPLAWVRVIGCGAVRLDFGHGVAVNASGRVLVAARFDATGAERNAADAADLVHLDASGSALWRAQIVNAEHLRAPSIAMDDTGAAYVAGPFAPVNGGGTLAASPHVVVAKLDAEGRPEWCAPLALMTLVQGLPLQPVIHVAADPLGGACIAMVEQGAIRVVRFNEAGALLWDRRFRFIGPLDPRVGVGVDASGAAYVWGSFAGALRFYDDDAPIRADGWERFLARVDRDGRVRWAQVLRALRTDDYSVAVDRCGGVVLAAVIRPRDGDECDPAARDLLVAQLDAEGSAISRTRFRGAAHACASVKVASTGARAVALAGYFSGAFTIAGREVRGATPASEATFAARLGEACIPWARAIQGPQLQAGLSVHGDAAGGVTLAGWCAGGATDFGSAQIEAEERAAFFVARYGA